MVVEHLVAGRRVLAAIVVAATAAVGGGASGAVNPSPQAEPGAEAPAIPCTPVTTTWPASFPAQPGVEPPQLAVVSTDLRPKDAVVLLDGRVVGRARFFNGKKGFLFLKPGRYRLELALDGYRSEAFTIDAKSGCRFDLRHRMERDRGSRSALPGGVTGKGEPTAWIWEPVGDRTTGSPRHRPGGPDPSLRPDLASALPDPGRSGPGRGSLSLRVTPPTASVSVDGEFLATGRELDLMVAPLAVSAGTHRIEVRAPGYASYRGEVMVAEGEEVTLAVSLEKGTP